jgi:putative ABC transport system permease protein
MPVEGPRFGTAIEIPGQLLADPGNSGAGVNMVTPAYYDTFGIRMLKGRAFDDRDRDGNVKVAIVNEAFVRLYLPDVEPVGQRVVFAPFAFDQTERPAKVTWEIVGVHADVINDGPGRKTFPEIHVPFWQVPWPRTVVSVRTAGQSAEIVAAVADVVRGLDAGLPLSEVRTIEQTLQEAVAPDRFYTVFFAAFAAVALVLAAVGIYGVMSFAVAQRTHEIGLRMALGAQRREVLTQVLREGMATAMAGTVLGGVGAALVGRALEGTVYGVDTANPLTFVAVAALLLGAALVACLVPARRAATVDPMVALRQE